MSPARLLSLLSAIILLIAAPAAAQSDSPLANLPVIMVENAAEIQEIARYGNGTLHAVAWQGDTLAAGGSQGVWLYDAGALDQAPRLLPITSYASDNRLVALSADGQRVAALDNQTLRVWDTVSGAEIATLSATGRLINLALSPDGELVIGEYYKEPNVWSVVLSVWQIATGIEIAHVEYPRQSFQKLIFHPDGTTVALLEMDAIQFLDIQAEAITTAYPAEPGDWYYGLSFSADGEQLALAQREGITVWNSAAEEQIAYVPVPMEISDIYLSPHGLELAVINTPSDGIWAWNYAENTPPVRIPALDRIFTFAFAPDNQQIAGIFIDSQLIVANAATGALVSQGYDHGSAWNMALIPASEMLALTAGNSYIELLNLANGTSQRIDTEYDLVGGLDVHPDGNLLAYNGMNFMDGNWTWEAGALTLLNLTSGESDTSQEQAVFWGIDFTPKGEALAAASSSGQVLEWATEGFGQTAGRVINADFPQASHIVYSSNARLLFVSDGNWVTRLIDVATGSDVPMGWENDLISEVVFNPNGSTLAGIYTSPGSGDSTIFLQNLASKEPETFLNYPASITSGLAFNPAGNLLASFIDGALVIFDVDTQTSLLRQQIYPDISELRGNLTFSSDGRFLVSATNDGLIRVWGIPGA